jgi:hypothetical protein
VDEPPNHTRKGLGVESIHHYVGRSSLSSDDEAGVSAEIKAARRRIADRKLVGPPMNLAALLPRGAALFCPGDMGQKPRQRS